MTLAKKKKKKWNGLEREDAEKWKTQENLRMIFRRFRHLEWVVSGSKEEGAVPKSQG